MKAGNGNRLDGLTPWGVRIPASAIIERQSAFCVRAMTVPAADAAHRCGADAMVRAARPRERHARTPEGSAHALSPRPRPAAGPASSLSSFLSGLAARAASACLLAACLALLLAAGAVQAQTASKLVGNTGQTTNSHTDFRWHLAQAFTTGSASRGYKLTRADLRLRLRQGAQPTYTVKIHSADSSGNPGASLGTLTTSTSLLAGWLNVQFTASGDGIDLAADTTYFVVLVATAGATQYTRWANTTSNAEDGGGAAGWSIAHNTRFRSNTDNSWGAIPGSAFQLAIYGYENPAPPRNSYSVTCAPPGNVWQIGGYWHVGGLYGRGLGDRQIPCDMAKPGYAFETRPGPRYGHINWIFDGTPGFWDQGNLPPPYNQPVQSVSYTVPGEAAHRAGGRDRRPVLPRGARARPVAPLGPVRLRRCGLPQCGLERVLPLAVSRRHDGRPGRRHLPGRRAARRARARERAGGRQDTDRDLRPDPGCALRARAERLPDHRERRPAHRRLGRRRRRRRGRDAHAVIAGGRHRHGRAALRQAEQRAAQRRRPSGRELRRRGGELCDADAAAGRLVVGDVEREGVE